MVPSQPGPSTFTVMVAVWMEGIFYGMNMVVYFTCICVIISRKARQDRKLNKGLLALSTLLFASATAHMALNIRRLIEGYIISPTKAAMDVYFGNIKQPLTVAHQFLLVTTYFFSDLIITWRVRIVWGFNWYIALIPLVLCLSTFTAGIGVAVSCIQPGQSIFSKTITQFGDAWIVLSLLTNVTATFLIASRIWWVTRGTSILRRDSFPSEPFSFGPRKSNEGVFNTWKRRNRQYWRLVVVIIESAACAAVMQVIQLVFYTFKFTGVYYVYDSAVQVMAMSPLLIIAFVGLTSDTTGEELSKSVSYSSCSTANGGRHRALISYGGNAVSGRGAGAVRGGGERFSGQNEAETLPPIEFNAAASFVESESEVGTRCTGKTEGADEDEEISSVPQRRQVESGMPLEDEEVEMHYMAV